MALVRVTNITTNRTLSFEGRNNLIHPGETKTFDSLTAEIQRMEDRGYASTEILGDPSDIPPVGGFDTVRDEIDGLYTKLNDSRQLSDDDFGLKGGS